MEVAVRKAGGYEENDRGTDLMRKAFNVDTGNLTDQSRLPAVKQAMSDFLAGAIGLYKNPSSHHEVNSRQKKPPKSSSSRVISCGSLIPVRRGLLTRQINLLSIHFTLTNRMKNWTIVIRK